MRAYGPGSVCATRRVGNSAATIQSHGCLMTSIVAKEPRRFATPIRRNLPAGSETSPSCAGRGGISPSGETALSSVGSGALEKVHGDSARFKTRDREVLSRQPFGRSSLLCAVKTFSVPVLKPQPGDPPELFQVPRDEGRAVREGRPRNQRIEGADGSPLALELRSNLRGLPRLDP